MWWKWTTASVWSWTSGGDSWARGGRRADVEGGDVIGIFLGDDRRFAWIGAGGLWECGEGGA
ncbi:hypothetical protein E2562_015651 [Oryza meyeriana var. granulata]|uniref:Uncharacterized protein n=1 Tax=Oryza meyeriana var. granulata TaxID=110450 RepID=A0A6G1D3W6_9ORYZ|nr:hypothetical protein E2562_015651 [Oryza meyeriana var. granulata]